MSHLLSDEKIKECSLALRKLRKRYDSLQSRDFFPSGAAVKTIAILDAASEKLRGRGNMPAPAVILDRSIYQGRTWVTRTHLYIDRLSSSWLISRFIDPKARFRFLKPGEKAALEKREIPFDIAGAEFSHQGELTTFEVIARGFGLLDPAVLKIVELVRFIDIQEEAILPDDAGLLKNLLDGLITVSASDHELLDHALLIFDALYAGYCQKNNP